MRNRKSKRKPSKRPSVIGSSQHSQRDSDFYSECSVSVEESEWKKSPPSVVSKESCQETAKSSPTRSTMPLVITIMGYLIRLVVLVVGWLYYKQWQTSQMPTYDMQNFIQKEKSNDIQVTNVTELPTDIFKIYSAASCLKGNSIEKLRESLRMQLDNVPESVRDRVINRALIEGISQKSSTTDSDSHLGKDGRATMFMAYWSTAYNGDETVLIGGSEYSTCILVTGIDFTLAETVVDYEETYHKELIGHQPCHCGLFSCEKCPIYDTVVKRKPIFARHVLSIDQQHELHHWMVREAVESAEQSLGIKQPAMLELSFW